VWTDHDAAVAAGYRVDAEQWRVLFDELMTIGGRFRRLEPRRRMRDFVRGLGARSELGVVRPVDGVTEYAMQTPDGAWRVEVVKRGRWCRTVQGDNQLDC